MTEILQENVTIEIGASSSRFACPKCSRSIRYRNRYPLDFKWKICPDCDRLWMRWPRPPFSGIRAEDHVGATFEVDVVAQDKPVRSRVMPEALLHQKGTGSDWRKKAQQLAWEGYTINEAAGFLHRSPAEVRRAIGASTLSWQR